MFARLRARVASGRRIKAIHGHVEIFSSPVVASSQPQYRERLLFPISSIPFRGFGKTYIVVTALIDTSILVYRFDPRFPLKQERATDLLRRGVADHSIVIPYQALIEFVAATTREVGGAKPLLSKQHAQREVEDMLAQFPVAYPSENTLRIALRGAALYQLSWFDALIWAYADEHGHDSLWSEDFQDGRLYGRVKVQDPFLTAVHESSAPYKR
jgi:predicted nucleic acid-binding protein